jgi:predicted helicase
MEDLQQTQIPGLVSLSEESHEAGRVKKSEPILVIMGNPPYSGISSNINKWTEELLKTNLDGAQSYYEIDGQKLKEKKFWLQDDYVKFLRFAQWKIHKAGRGIVAMITNHSYLDNPTFRGMRQSLMKTFNEIFILDLHGNSLKKEKTPDGGKDENVFDIQQGVAIALFIRDDLSSEYVVHHADLFGEREKKYHWLDIHPFAIDDYLSLYPESPWYFFIKHQTEKIEHFIKWNKINEIFPINNVGIVSARDGFAIDFSKETLAARVRQFRNLSFDDDFFKTAYKLKDTSTFKIKKFREEYSKVVDWENDIRSICYRPFDTRSIIFSEWIIERRIYDVMQHMLKYNIGLTCDGLAYLDRFTFKIKCYC